MNTLKKVAATLAIVGFLPFVALANGDSHSLNLHGPIGGIVNAQIKGGDNDNDKDDIMKIKPPVAMPPIILQRSVEGTVTSTSSTGFTLQSKNNSSFTVNTSSTTIVTAFGQTLTLADIESGENAVVHGSVTGSVITANRIIITPANTHPASAKGTVTAVSGNTITIQANHTGVPYQVTVNTNASTTVMSGGRATTTAAITVGSKISVKGLWDSIVNVLNAIKIRIK